ncbi:MAG: radical SAM family heme chaperone HemW [Chloroflexi bacterium]|nr:radical SAM family heme chaperone HemW [Chloroflexota bacterium]
MKMRGLYIHIPFCVQKCRYCDFYSLPGRLSARQSYVDAVLRESEAYAGMSFQTMYLGGGTPSLLGSKLVTELICGLSRSLDLAEVVESTIEVNPESATREFLEAIKGAGINRVSIGVQSLADSELKAAGRIHTAAQALETVILAKRLGFQAVSADLIIGLPGQTWSTLRRALETLVHAGIEHLSLYCLSLEEGTPLAQNPPDDLPSDDQQAELFQYASSFLGGHRYVHYEISNFALEGYECRHNLNYWRGGEYLGLGPAAASHLDGKRFRNRADLNDYLEQPNGLTEDSEELPAKDKAAEEAMLRLRLLVEGIEVSQLRARFGQENIAALINRLAGMADDGRLIGDGGRYRLPPARVLTSNPILAEVIEAASPQ